MNTEANTFLLLGIGETGLGVAEIIKRNEIKGLTACGIRNETDFKRLEENVMAKAEVVVLVADLGYEKTDSLALQAVKLLKENGKIVVTFITIPGLWEGESAIRRALESAHAIGHIVDATSIINKGTISPLPEEGWSFAGFMNFLTAVEELIAEGIQNMIALISGSGAVNIDLQDLMATLEGSGTFTIGWGEGAGEDRIRSAIDDALSSPLMKGCDVATTRRVLIKVLAPKDAPLTMEEMMVASQFIEPLPTYADVKWGVGESDDKDTVTVIIIAAGVDR